MPVHLLTQLSHNIPLVTSVGWFATNISEALIGAYLLQRLRAPRELFETFVGVLLFFGVVLAGVIGLTSFLDAAVVVGTGMGEGYWDLWCHRFASNALATLTLVPPIVTIGSSTVTRFRVVRRARYFEAGLLALAALFAINLMFARHQDAQSSIPELTYTVLPLMFWAAVRFGPTGVSILQLVSTGAILWTALHGLVVSLDDVLALQMFLLMLNGLSLSLAVVVRESSRFQSLHSAVLRSMRNAVAITDSDGVVIDANEAWIAAACSVEPGRLDGIGLHANYLAHHRVHAHRDSNAAKLAGGLESILSGARKLFEMEYVYRSGPETKWFSIAVVPLWGDQRGAVVTHTDITRQAGGGRDAATAGGIDARGSRDDDGDAVLQRLRSWFSKGRHDSEQLDLNDLANDVIEILRGDLLRRGVTLTRRLSPKPVAIAGDRVQLQQVVLNLVLNACDAMRDNPPGDRHVLAMTAPCEAGVRLSVEDIGTGMTPDQLNSVFEPFMTTKTTGLGLGLALCRSIVHAHEGRLTAENNPARGVTFHCILPRADSRSQDSRGEQAHSCDPLRPSCTNS